MMFLSNYEEISSIILTNADVFLDVYAINYLIIGLILNQLLDCQEIVEEVHLDQTCV